MISKIKEYEKTKVIAVATVAITLIACFTCIVCKCLAKKKIYVEDIDGGCFEESDESSDDE